jgi:VanZ family protein
MKNLLFALLLSFSSTAQIGLDKYAHFGTFFTASYVFTDIKIQDNNYRTFEYFAATQMTTLFFGGVKEFADATVLNGTPSWNDILANQIGALAGTAFAIGINKYKERRKLKNKAIKL